MYPPSLSQGKTSTTNSKYKIYIYRKKFKVN